MICIYRKIAAFLVFLHFSLRYIIAMYLYKVIRNLKSTYLSAGKQVLQRSREDIQMKSSLILYLIFFLLHVCDTTAQYSQPLSDLYRTRYTHNPFFDVTLSGEGKTKSKGDKRL
ncbi:hypothetical protein BJX68DRAFT_147348 [Aspergillus pseudodeflectus]|uniref:Uncharacterized protein n=1 Tax=Aspergillus pseudodeflectus TaxID=176178 RepID=A0ABR4JX79_9EURO